MEHHKTKHHVVYCIIMFVSLACLITALCTFDYNFDTDLVASFNANVVAYVFASVWAVTFVTLVIAFIVTKAETVLALEITVVVLLEFVLSIPIFIVWVVQRIQDATATKQRDAIK